MGFSLRSAAAVAALATSTVLAAPQQGYGGGNLPVVDLGYERHQAALYNSTGQFYNFTNIRYAAPRTLYLDLPFRCRNANTTQLSARTASAHHNHQRRTEARFKLAPKVVSALKPALLGAPSLRNSFRRI